MLNEAHRINERGVDAMIRAMFGPGTYVCPVIREKARQGIAAYLSTVHRAASDPHKEAIVLDRARAGFRIPPVIAGAAAC